jgi:hypothetical protein
MDREIKQKLLHGHYEVGYGKPPTAGQFVRGKSGNPRGRPAKGERKKPQTKAVPDASTRDRFLQAMARTVTLQEKGVLVEIPLLDAVHRAEIAAALKGNPNAQRNIIEREARYRAELKAEIDADHAYWKEYIVKYHKAVAVKASKGDPVPIDWIHPDDIIFKEGCHVQIEGGADPAEYHRQSQNVARMRDAFMLQAAKDERCFAGSLGKTPIFLSGLLAMLANTSLPKRMQLDENQYFWQSYKNSTLRLRELKRRLRMAWTDLGHPEWADTLTPALRPDALERLRAWNPKKV